MTEEPRAIRTNGEGNTSTYHLNFTRTLAPYVARDKRKELLRIKAGAARRDLAK